MPYNPFRQALEEAYVDGMFHQPGQTFDTTTLDKEWEIIEAALEWFAEAKEEMRWVIAQKTVGVNPSLKKLFQAVEAYEKEEG